MSRFDKAIARVTARVASTMGNPATFLNQPSNQPIPTTIILERDIEVVGQFVDVVEQQTQASLLVADVAAVPRDSLIVFPDMVYVVKRHVANDGSMIVVEVLDDGVLFDALKPLDLKKTFTETEWVELWQTISNHRSAM